MPDPTPPTAPRTGRTPASAADRRIDGHVRTALAAATAALPAGEERPGQVEMAIAVGRAITDKRPLIVQAGTGTGKSLAYLVPAIVSGTKVVIATATKALQDQLADKDLPFLAEHLDRPFTFSVLKGRSNYVCRQRVHEATTSDAQGTLEGTKETTVEDEVRRLAEWAETSPTGDRAELDFEPSVRGWGAVSVGPRECPGAANCPRGGDCFAEQARTAAAEADVVVVNTHLYSLSLEAGGALLPDHDVVVIDEAHQFEDVVSNTFGLELSGGRFTNLARIAQAIVADPATIADLELAGERIADALADDVGRRLRGAMDPALSDAVVAARFQVEKLLSTLRSVPDDGPGDVGARKQRALKAAGTMIDDLDYVSDVPVSHVAWIEGSADSPVLKVAPIDVAEVLRGALWDAPATAVLTSATIPSGLGERLGLEAGQFDTLDAGSPFDYATNALLYCAAHLPDPRHADYEEQMHKELEALLVAAGGRTLALFTSYRAMNAAADALRPRVPWPILTQNDLPKPALVARFAEEEETSLFATMGFWQGIDVPGPSLSLVTIDRLPFPRPDEPLLQARRERARADAFRVVDLPRAATLMAQGAGRLIRRSTDTGVVAVLDPRLANSASYRWEIVSALPPMRRTRDLADAETLLRAIRDRAT